jgi:Fic family protein
VKPWIPEKLPLAKIDWGALAGLIGRANAALARYDGFLQSMVNPAVLLSPMLLQEAVLSSRIEGTDATMEEVLEHEAGARFEERKELDIQEIANYRKALLIAEQRLKEMPICLNLIRKIHSVLLDSVRGHNRASGEFRRIQNWIGRPGRPIEEATFVPPDLPHLKEALDNWEKYIHAEEKDPLVQLAIVHGQFEVIHPFLDGNGRVGRILIPLFLHEKKILARPMFYLSVYLEQHRPLYYERLRGITREKDWHSWISFFLEATLFQANENTQKARAIRNLYDAMKERVASLTRSHYALACLDVLFTAPIFNSAEFIKISSIPKQTAMVMLRQLRGGGVIRELIAGSGRRPAILVFPDLMNVAEGKKVV